MKKEVKETVKKLIVCIAACTWGISIAVSTVLISLWYKLDVYCHISILILSISAISETILFIILLRNEIKRRNTLKCFCKDFDDVRHQLRDKFFKIQAGEIDKMYSEFVSVERLARKMSEIAKELVDADYSWIDPKQKRWMADVMQDIDNMLNSLNL